MPQLEGDEAVLRAAGCLNPKWYPDFLKLMEDFPDNVTVEDLRHEESTTWLSTVRSSSHRIIDISSQGWTSGRTFVWTR